MALFSKGSGTVRLFLEKKIEVTRWATVVLALVIAVPILTIACLAFVEERAFRDSSSRERFITSVASTISAPGSYIGVDIAVAYYYTKASYRVRAVVTLPTGYGYDNTTTAANTSAFVVTDILPAWACHPDPLGTFVGTSFFVKAGGWFGLDVTDTLTLNTMLLNNVNTTNGQLSIYNSDNSFSGSTALYLGNGECNDHNDDTEMCLPDFVGDFSFELMAPVDRAAWGAQYDAAVVA